MEFYHFGNSLTWEFNCLYFLAEEIEKFLKKGADEKFSEYLKVYEGYDSWIKQEIRMQGYITVADILRLSKENPIQYYKYKQAEQKSSSVNLRSSELEMFNEDFPTISWASLTIMSYSTFEHVLMRFLRYVADNEKIDVNLTPSKTADYLNFCKKIIQEKLQLDLNFEVSKNWCLIKERKIIRNLIVHNGGFVKDGDTDNKKLIRRNKNADLKENQIIINREFVTDTIQRMQEFIIELLDVVQKKHS